MNQSSSNTFQMNSKKPAIDYGIYPSHDRVNFELVRNGHRHRKAFMHATYGGPKKALRAARAWRDTFLKDHPQQFKRDVAQRRRSDNSSGIPGVMPSIDASTGAIRLWIAATQVRPGEVLRKAFSVGRWGEKAKAMAIAERKKQLEAMDLNVLAGSHRARSNHVAQRYKGSPEPISLRISRQLPTVSEIPPELPNKRQKVGCSGVWLVYSKSGAPAAWQAMTRIGYDRQTKVFKIVDFGYEGALKMAIRERGDQVRRALALKASGP